jgi:hypothetical protein
MTDMYIIYMYNVNLRLATPKRGGRYIFVAIFALTGRGHVVYDFPAEYIASSYVEVPLPFAPRRKAFSSFSQVICGSVRQVPIATFYDTLKINEQETVRAKAADTKGQNHLPATR